MSPTHVRSGTRPRYGRSRAIALLSALALALFFAAPALAQEAGRVVGQVTDEANGQAVEGAQVVIAGTGIGTITNEAGRFLLVNVPEGSHTIRVEMIGYGVVSQEISVSAGGVSM